MEQALGLAWIPEVGDRICDDATRRLIRVQAMKQAAAMRKASRTWGKTNMRQPPSVICTRELNASAAADGWERARGAHLNPTASSRSACRLADSTKQQEDSNISSLALVSKSPKSTYVVPEDWFSDPTCMVPLSGIERLLVDTKFNILDLNELTHIHMGHAAGQILSRQPDILHRLIRRRSRSFLSEVPSRYGNTACLDDAVQSVTLRAHRLLAPSAAKSIRKELSLYGRALQGLQEAVDDKTQRLSPDVLCTIQLLSLYEVS
jgi:hypothetical protein